MTQITMDMFSEKRQVVKKNIHVAFASFVAENNKKVLLEMLRPQFNVIVNQEEYDYYFVDEVMYYRMENMQEVLAAKREAIKIMLAYEAVFPDLNIFDYAICFVNQFNCQDRILHLPYLEMLNKSGYGALISKLDSYKDNNIKKSRFCNFIYGNDRGHNMRETLFWEISKYKQVDSLGKFLNNVVIENTREDVDWLQKSIQLKCPYKFSIAAENAIFPGYTSEKIVTSMLAGTIPIYWGNPDVELEYNGRSFINVMNYTSLDEVVKKIKLLDEDDTAYENMMQNPWRTDEQIEQCQVNINQFYKSFYKIFETDVKYAHRRPEGCWPDSMYPEFFKSYMQKQKRDRIIDRVLDHMRVKAYK